MARLDVDHSLHSTTMSKYRTPWSASASGTLTSDRLKPKATKQAGNSASKGNKKGKDVAPKSPRVRELEGILIRLKESEGKAKDPEGGCFCQGEGHLEIVFSTWY